MAIAPAADAAVFARPRLSTEKLRSALLWLMGFAGAFVFVEPGPYEIIGVLTILVFALAGLGLRAPLVPLVLLLVLLNLGYATALIQVSDQSKSVIWVCISAFLAATAIFYAAMLGHNTQARLDLEQISALLDEMLQANAQWLPLFEGATTETTGR